MNSLKLLNPELLSSIQRVATGHREHETAICTFKCFVRKKKLNLIYTDGLTEFRNNRDLAFGSGRLMESMSRQKKMILQKATASHARTNSKY